MNATGLWRRVALSFSKVYRYIVQTQQILYVLWLDDLIVHIWDHMPWHRKLFFFCMRDVHAPVSYPAAECCCYRQYTVQQELESSPVGLNAIVQALHTNTSSVRSCLLQHLFIDCLVTLYVWVGIADTQRNAASSSARRRQEKNIKKKKGFESRKHFLVCFYIPWELPFTHSPGSQSQLWAFSIGRNADRRMEKKGKLSKRKKREAKLSSQGHHLKKQNKK